MARRSQSAVDYLRAIETLSESEEPLKRAVSQQGPGGEAYNLAPNPPTPQAQKGMLYKIGERAQQFVSSIKKNAPEPGELAHKASKEAGGLQRRAATFLKHNAVFIAGIAVFGASLFAARKYWNR